MRRLRSQELRHRGLAGLIEDSASHSLIERANVQARGVSEWRPFRCEALEIPVEECPVKGDRICDQDWSALWAHLLDPRGSIGHRLLGIFSRHEELLAV